MGKTTIDDIARMARVSKTTVSRFINGRYESMSETTRDDIARIIKQSNYYPSSAARRLKSGKSTLVGVMISVSINSKLVIQLMWGICQKLREHGYTPVIYDCDEGEEEKDLQACLGQDLAGLIFSPLTTDLSLYEKVVETGKPIVLVDRYNSNWKHDAVFIEHYRITTDALHHLYDQGYRRLAFFSDEFVPVSNKTIRQTAYSDFIRAHPDLGGEFICKQTGHAEIRKELGKFLKKDPGLSKAVFAVDGDSLLSVLQAAADKNLSMPGDIGVCGYDSWGWAQLVGPGVTTITQPTREMGSKAVERLVELINKPEPSHRPKLTCLKARLDIRGSTMLSR